MKTLGFQTARLTAELHNREHTIFSLAEVEEITGLSPALARSLMHKAQQRGIVTRLKPGLYNLVPFELGHATEHTGNPYLIAAEAVKHKPYFLSHATAFELHRMVTQPNFLIFVSCTTRIRPQIIGGYEYHFVHVKSEHFFGITKHWINKRQAVAISDLERTVIDGLHHPHLVGGISEAAKGIWLRRQDLRYERLVEYAHRLDVGAVTRRLGYLLEFYGLADGLLLGKLRDSLSNTYQRLDPMLPAEGHFLSRWRLQLNVTPEELDAVRFS